jgi:hypothetical protein
MCAHYAIKAHLSAGPKKTGDAAWARSGQRMPLYHAPSSGEVLFSADMLKFRCNAAMCFRVQSPPEKSGGASVHSAGVDTAGTSMGCGATGWKAMSSSKKPFTADPLAIWALVPVVRKPASGTNAMAATTPPVPVTPLSSKLPVSRKLRSAIRMEMTLAPI